MQQLSFIKTEYRSCAFTGHRILPSKIKAKNVQAAIEELIKSGVETFYNGLAMGWDLLTAECIVKLQKKYPSVRLVGCVPFYGQERTFPARDQIRYAKVLKACNEVVTFGEHYYEGCYFKRNDYMVEHADVLFAYCLTKTGGAAYTVRKFAKSKGEENILFFE